MPTSITRAERVEQLLDELLALTCTPAEYAERTGLSLSTVRQYASTRSAHVPAVNSGLRVIVDPTEPWAGAR